MTLTPLQALATDKFVQTTATGGLGTLTDTDIDAFELEASRRILLNLRELLFGQPMLDLIRDQVDASTRRYQDAVAASGGEYQVGQIILGVKGISAKELFPWIAANIGAAMAAGDDDERKRTLSSSFVFPMHPEHYAMAPGGVGVIETMGGAPTLTYVGHFPDGAMPEFVAELIDPSYEFVNAGRGVLSVGGEQSYVLQQFKDTTDGLEANLRIWYPTASPASAIEEHLKHYAVEFRNAIRMAAAQLKS
ncbi:hypothetical protein [Mycolicibacterium fortuitum]|uniref:hypothetical protein n=1 Tax=Mycolicibacterium TaxID=1866885 RepID=UPI003AAC4268